MPPTALISTLDGVRRRVQRLSVLYGVGMVVSATAGLLILTVAIDYLLDLPAPPRLLIMLASLVGIGYVLAQWVVRPALARLGLSDVAGKLETAFPDFNDRLRSSIDFLTKGIPGSDYMKDRVAAEAAELAGRFDLNKAVKTRPVYQSAGMAAAAVALVIFLGALIGHEYLVPAVSRLLSPFANHPWPKRVRIEVLGNMPGRVPVGQHVDVRLRLSKGDRASREARVYYQYGDGRIEQEIMSRGGDGIYSASLDARADAGNAAMKVWFEAGDDRTPTQSVDVVPRLSIARAELVVTPPPYVSEPPTVFPLDSAPATVTFGSSLALRAAFNKPLDHQHAVSMALSRGQTKMPTATWDAVDGNLAVAHWIARESSTFQIRAFDADGFVNSDMVDYQVIVRPDLLPSVQITQPARNEECTPEAVIPLQAIAEDDFGIQSMILFASRLGDKPQAFPPVDLVIDGKPTANIKLTALPAAGDRRRWQMDYNWDLAHLDTSPLKPGDLIEYHVEVRDNYRFDGQTHDPVPSGRYRVTIMSQEQFTQLMNDLLNNVREQITDIRNSQSAVKEGTTDLRDETQKQPQFSNADRQEAQNLIGRQTTAAAQARQTSEKLNGLVERMRENRSRADELQQLALAVGNGMNQVAEQPMKEAAGQIDDARNQTANPADDSAKARQRVEARNAELDSARRNQQTAVDRLDQLIDQMGEVGGLPKAIADMKQLLAEQEANVHKSNDVGLKNLGKTPDQMDPADRQAQQANAQEQAKLGEKSEKAIESLQSDSQKLRKSDPASADAMAKAAQTGQQQNVPAQMQSSAKAQQDNHQDAAQQAQAQAEIGLQMMIRELQEAQNRKLEELARKLADLREQIAQLIRQQSGLNYDSLALRGGDVLGKTDAKTVDQLLLDADRNKVKLPPTPDISTQGRLQEQSERNARSVAKQAEPLPEGATISATLNRAADRMGRAITFLRDDGVVEPQRLASAYDPPQVEALEALKKARMIVDEQAAKVAQQQQQQQKDAIRVVFEKILADQEKIDADTKTIDQAPRTEDGQLKRENIVKARGELATRQGDLADRSVKVNDDLAALGGIVYTWADKDITDTMREVRQQLSRPDTGAVTQAEQARIEEQLRAMIESLKVKPKDNEFARKQSGGGGGDGGGGASPLPPEAELRLLKQLQEAVNRSTETIARQGNGQEPALTALGGRQGELRNLLDQVLQKASRGQMKLGPAADGEKLPEEAGEEALDKNELQENLLNGDGQPDPNAMKKDVDLVGQRMARSRQRLSSDHDPGAVTQEIQKRIVENMDALIAMARAQQQQSSGQGQSSQQQANALNPNNSQPNNGQQNNTGGATPAQRSTEGREAAPPDTPTTDIVETRKEWGNLPDRARQAIIESASEKQLDKYKKLIDDYYRALGAQKNQ